MIKKFISIVAVSILFCVQANATTITYSATPNGASSFDLLFEVTNDTLGSDIEEFTIFFDLGVFENLRDPTSPTDWDPLLIQPDAGIPDNGFADWLAFGAPIGIDETLGGFGLTLDLIGSSLPMMLAFDIIDPNTFDILDSGFASLVSGGPDPAPIPVPATFWLFLTGAATLWKLRKRS
ncbi:MAG: hypothetical protein AAGA09_03225 [Pseudomonadota bacterium]